MSQGRDPSEKDELTRINFIRFTKGYMPEKEEVSYHKRLINAEAKKIKELR